MLGFLFFLRRVLQLTVLIEHTIGGAQNDELRPSVQLVAYFLFLLVLKGGDELLGQHIVLLQPVVFLGQLLADCLGLLLSIALRV